jgi:zinc transporter ZupT
MKETLKTSKIITNIMTANLILVLILSVAFGIFFFIADYFEHKIVQLHASIIAGISVAYFFLIVLPEIAERLPENPFNLQIFEYLFVLIGFTFIHISEKLILQNVEMKTQRKMRKLIKKEKVLEAVEHNIENILTRELTREELDEAALRELARTVSELNVQEEDMKIEINNYKIKIQNHINKELTRFRILTDYVYHFLVGIILVGLLKFEIIAGILFFIYAFFRTVVTKRSEAHLIFTDLEIYEEVKHDEKPIIKYMLGTSALTGILIGLIFNSIFPVNLELLFIFYSFISGVILYVIVREVVPEKEKGDPLKFLIGLIGFALVIFVINIYTNVL